MKCCNFVSSLIDDSDECDNGGSENTSQLEKNSDAKQLTLEDYRSDAESKNIDVWFGGSHFVFEYQISKCAMESFNDGIFIILIGRTIPNFDILNHQDVMFFDYILKLPPHE
jgi:hypothetical protein